MTSYNVNFKNDDYITVEVEEDAPAPKLVVTRSTSLGTEAVVTNLPDGYSVDPYQVLYIEPSDD